MVRITAASATVSATPPCVWSLLVLPDGTLVSGDGEGAVQLWDGAFGTLLHRFVRHKADVLALAAAPDGSAIFAAGVDAQVAMFSPITAGSGGGSGSGSGSGKSSHATAAAVATAPGTWSYLDYKRPHSHDVKAMDVVVLAGGKAVLVSGGLDAQLVAYPVGGFLKEHPVRLSRAPQRPICQVAPGLPRQLVAAPAAAAPSGTKPDAAAAVVPVRRTGGRHPARMLCTSNGECDVWQLGQNINLRQVGYATNPVGSAMASRSKWQTQQQGEGFPVDLIGSPRHLAQIKLGDGARVACSAISPAGGFVSCCSGRGPIRLYRLIDGPEVAGSGGALPASAGGRAGRGAHVAPAAGPLTVERIKMPAGTERAVTLTLTDRLLIAAHPDGSVSCFELPPPAAAATAATDDNEEAAAAAAGQGVRSARGALRVAHSSALDVSGKQADRHRLSWKQYTSPLSVLAVSPDGSVLAGAGASGMVLLRLPTAAAAAAITAVAPGGGSDEEEEEAKEAPAPSVPPLQRMGKVLHTAHDSPVSGLSFSADGKLLAGALASGSLAVFDVEAARPMQVRRCCGGGRCGRCWRGERGEGPCP